MKSQVIMSLEEYKGLILEVAKYKNIVANEIEETNKMKKELEELKREMGILKNFKYKFTVTDEDLKGLARTLDLNVMAIHRGNELDAIEGLLRLRNNILNNFKGEK